MTGTKTPTPPTMDRLFDFLKTASPDVISKLTGTVDQLADTIRTVDTNRTTRARIEADARVEIHRMDTQKELIRDYFARAFAERAAVFGGQFRVLDEALAAGQPELAVAALGAVVETVKTSPLSNTGEFRALLSSGATLKLE